MWRMSSGTASPNIDLRDIFQTLDDWKVGRTQRHDLAGIRVISTCAMLCGQGHYIHMEAFGNPSPLMARRCAENLATLRRLTPATIKREDPTSKKSVNQRRFEAGLSTDFRQILLGANLDA